MRKFVHDPLERITGEPGTKEGMEDLGNYIYAQIADHRDQSTRRPHELSAERRDRRPAVSDDIAGGMIVLLLIAGIDTTW